jgi:L-lactate permease
VRYIRPVSTIALIPFLVLFASFALFRIPLTYASFIALLSCVAVAGASMQAFQNSLVFLFEIGLIVFGSFFFIEVAEHKGVIRSLADLVREVSKNRIVQAMLVAFPLGLIVEGSSGFGTPLLIIAPILRALGLPLILCALLPLINMVNGIPFGALGTPIRLGFGSVTQDFVAIGSLTTRSLLPFFFYTPVLSYFLIRKKIRAHDGEKQRIWLLWSIALGGIYAWVTTLVSHRNVEFPALAGALVTFVFGVFSAHFIETGKVLFIQHRKGLMIYTLFLTLLWAGKNHWMDEKIPGTPLRIFNPGWVFIGFGLVLAQGTSFLKPALNRSRKTITVLFCMTFIVQQLNISGAIKTLLNNIPHWLLDEGSPLLGWLSSALIGTGTIANLFLAPLTDATNYGVIAAGTAIGVPSAFQAIIGVKSILKDQIEEKEILRYFVPIGVSFVTLAMLFRHLTHS